ncbi:hypothetical protein [Clostridium cadaveris]|uniref:hypothetical protein n=1 Tax=Clostridium cadaveris TaxID=1529 RepID=UPI0015D4EBAC|nr:hypothetical protein [Clostridium cadaveris]MDM8313612.1 hypothetical protein [Clostridium cadaveris]
METISQSAKQLKEGCAMALKNIFKLLTGIISVIGLSVTCGIFSFDLAGWSS